MTDDNGGTIATELSRPTRDRKQPERLTFHQTKDNHVTLADKEWHRLEQCHNLIAEVHPNPDQDRKAMFIARGMSDINSKVTIQGASFAQSYIIQLGLKKFGQCRADAASKEINQLHQRNYFTPIDVASMTPEEQCKSMDVLMFLAEKRNKSITGRMVHNGKPTLEWLSREDSASPTAALESITLTETVNTKESCDVMTCDIPNALIQTMLSNVEQGGERVIMKITGVLVDFLMSMSPELYGPYVGTGRHRRVIYVQVLRGLYRMLVAALLWYMDFKQDLEEQGFTFNPYDPCVVNQIINERCHTVWFHVNDFMCSHKDPKVNDEFE